MLTHSADSWRVATIFPAQATMAEQLKFLIQYAILAPSEYNSQPWRFRVAGDALHLYADRTRALPMIDPDDREMTISCGTALGNIRVALHHFGYSDLVELLPDPADRDLLARIRIGARQEVELDDTELFNAIPRRHTTRLPFENRTPAVEVLERLETVASNEGVQLHLTANMYERLEIADLISKADRHQMADKHFRRELATWLHPSRSATHDGMPDYAFGLNALLDAATPVVASVIRTFDLGEGIAARDHALADGSPVLAIFHTAEDTPASWLATGQALAAVLLRACSLGVTASFLNQPVEVPELRTELRETLKLAGVPQVILRMGHGAWVTYLPRRPVSAVLM